MHTLGGLTAAVDTPQLASDADTQKSSLFMREEDLADFVFFIAYCIWNIRIDIYNKENQKLKERIQ